MLNFFQSIFILILRLYWGWQFFQAGLGKLSHIQKPIQFFTDLGIPLPTFNAYLVGSIEMIGGLLLLVGFFARLVSIPLIVVLLTALFTAHAEATFNLFRDPDTFFEQAPFLFLYASWVVLLFGPGQFSLDHLFHNFFLSKKEKIV